MVFEQQKYFEPLGLQELLFLQRKEKKERRIYYIIYTLLFAMSLLLPFLGAWYWDNEHRVTTFSVFKFFFSATILLFISTFSIYMVYRVYLMPIQKDIASKSKTIEGFKIRKKAFVTLNKTYHFYIDSFVKLSIEVTEEDFNKYAEGDEVYIEYSTHSKQYFGYF